MDKNKMQSKMQSKMLAAVALGNLAASSHNPAPPASTIVVKGSVEFFDAREAKLVERLAAAKQAEDAAKENLLAELQPLNYERAMLGKLLDDAHLELAKIAQAIREVEEDVARKQKLIESLTEEIACLERAKKLAETVLRPEAEGLLSELAAVVAVVDAKVEGVRKKHHRITHRAEREREKLSARLARVRGRRPKE